MIRREVIIDGVTYRAEREALVRDGGDRRQWFIVRCDTRLIVDLGTFPTMGAAHAALRWHLGRAVAQRSA